MTRWKSELRERHPHLTHRQPTRRAEDQAVAVEGLAVKGLVRTRSAKSVHDAGWSAFVGMPECKAARYGPTVPRDETGTHPKTHRTTARHAGISALEDREDVTTRS